MSGPRVVLQSPACTAWPNEEYRPAEWKLRQDMVKIGLNTSICMQAKTPDDKPNT